MRTVQITEKSNNERYKPIGIDDITERDTNKLVVVITDHDNMRVIESLALMKSFDSDPADRPDSFSLCLRLSWRAVLFIYQTAMYG